MPQKRIPTMTRYLSKVSNNGDPKACWPWTGAKDKDGYGIFWDGTYWPSGKGHYVRVTRWTYEQFVGPIPDRQQLCHKCDNPPCVNPAHLFLGTCADNHQDRERKGRGNHWKTHGESHYAHKLTEQQVLAMRARHAAGGTSLEALAREYGVSGQLVGLVIRRKVWKHI